MADLITLNPKELFIDRMLNSSSEFETKTGVEIESIRFNRIDISDSRKAGKKSVIESIELSLV